MDYLTPEFSSAGNLWSLKCPPGCLQLLDTSVFLSSVSDFVINDQMFWFTNYWRVTTEKYTHRLSNVISLGNCAKPQNILFVSTLQSYKMLSGSYLQIGVVWRFISILASAAFLCTWLCEASVASEKCPTSLGISGDIWSISEKNSGHDFDNVRERGEERKKEKRERQSSLWFDCYRHKRGILDLGWEFRVVRTPLARLSSGLALWNYSLSSGCC